MVLGESSFWFRFPFIIQFLPLWSMDDKAEAEPKIVLAKYYEWISKSANWQIYIQDCQTSSKMILQWTSIKFLLMFNLYKFLSFRQTQGRRQDDLRLCFISRRTLTRPPKVRHSSRAISAVKHYNYGCADKRILFQSGNEELLFTDTW